MYKIENIVGKYLNEDDTETQNAYKDGDYEEYMKGVIRSNIKYLYKGVNGWKGDENTSEGSFIFTKGKFVVYITPFWDDTKGIAVAWESFDGEDLTTGEPIDQFGVPFKVTGNMDKDFKSYMTAVKKIVNKPPK